MPEMSTTAQTPTVDAGLEALANDRRRSVIRILDEHGEQSLGTLARRVAAREDDTTPELVDADTRKVVYVGLYQCHLETLSDAGAVTVDDRTNAVSPGPALDEYVEALDDLETVFVSEVSR